MEEKNLGAGVTVQESTTAEEKMKKLSGEQRKEHGTKGGNVYCRWCGESVAPENLVAHTQSCKNQRKIKNHPFYRYLWGYGKEKAWDEISDKLLDIIKKFLEKYLFSLFLTISIVASVAAIITGTAEYKVTNLTAEEIRAAMSGEAEILPEPSEEPTPTEEPSPSEEPVPSEAPSESNQSTVEWTEIEEMNTMLREYTEAVYFAQNSIPMETSLDSFQLEQGAGAISGFSAVHDYVTYGEEYSAYNLDAIPRDQYGVIRYLKLSADEINVNPVTTLTYGTELSKQLLAEGFRVAEFTMDCYLMIGERGTTQEECAALAADYRSFVFVLVEVDGTWYVAADYLVERSGA